MTHGSSSPTAVCAWRRESRSKPARCSPSRKRNSSAARARGWPTPVWVAPTRSEHKFTPLNHIRDLSALLCNFVTAQQVGEVWVSPANALVPRGAAKRPRKACPERGEGGLYRAHWRRQELDQASRRRAARDPRAMRSLICRSFRDPSLCVHKFFMILPGKLPQISERLRNDRQRKPLRHNSLRHNSWTITQGSEKVNI